MVEIGKLVDITGQKFGKLTVIKQSDIPSNGNSKKWLCKCDCGNEKHVRSIDLRTGRTASCGCRIGEEASKRMKKHGMSGTLLYKIWKSMRGRCNRPTSKDYENYGGRGIKVCPGWDTDFTIFHTWAIKNGYKEHLTIDRIDVNGNYESENCRWLENEKQALNTRRSKFYEYEGEMLSAREISEKTGLNYNTVKSYLNKGKSLNI